MNIKETKRSIILAGHKAVEELIKVAKEAIVDSDDDISADRLKNAAATKKLAIFVGSRKAFAMAVGQIDNRKRQTALADLAGQPL